MSLSKEVVRCTWNYNVRDVFISSLICCCCISRVKQYIGFFYRCLIVSINLYSIIAMPYQEKRGASKL